MKFKSINGIVNIRISSDGDVHYITTGKSVYRINNSGYHRVTAQYENGVRRDVLAHRLVAEAFIPNPKNKKEVNHIDGNKLNNNPSNLEWCTHKENMQHASKLKLIGK